MYAMAFFAFLRVGEIRVLKRDSVNGNLLQLDQVSTKRWEWQCGFLDNYIRKL